MADVDHPKTHVEDQEVDLPREQPVSPKHEGIDPLTESDTMYPREDIKAGAEAQAKKDAKASGVDTSAMDETVAAQTNLGAGDEPSNDTAPELDEPAADSDADNVNASGKLPTDAKVANDVGSDKGNTSVSNKPATKNS